MTLHEDQGPQYATLDIRRITEQGWGGDLKISCENACLGRVSIGSRTPEIYRKPNPLRPVIDQRSASILRLTPSDAHDLPRRRVRCHRVRQWYVALSVIFPCSH